MWHGAASAALFPHTIITTIIPRYAPSSSSSSTLHSHLCRANEDAHIASSMRRKKGVIMVRAAGNTGGGDDQTFLTLEEAGLIELSNLDMHERFLCRLTVSSLNLLRVISKQEGIPIEQLNAGIICDWFQKDKEKREKDFNSATLKWHYTNHVMGLNAYDRHKKFMHDFVLHYNKSSLTSKEKRPVKTDQDTLRETYRFIRSEEDDSDNSWEQRLAKRYYDKLFKEYCIADMTHYKDGKIGLRWRSEKELISGKGQFICGNKPCDIQEELSSFEDQYDASTVGMDWVACQVNFSYKEAGESKQALVKLRVCPGCAEKLNYRKERERKLMQSLRDKDDEDNHWSKSEIDENPGSSKKRRTLDSKHGSEGGDGRQRGTSRLSPPFSQKKEAIQQRSSDEEYDKYFEGMFL